MYLWEVRRELGREGPSNVYYAHFALPILKQTYFYLVRSAYSMTPELDLAVEGRLLTQMTAQDRLVGYNTEVGYVVAKNLRAAIGYNFKGYKERDLVDYKLWSRGP